MTVTSAERVTATRQTIAEATYFDTRGRNRNCDDDEAHREVKRNLDRLIDAEQLRLMLGDAPR